MNTRVKILASLTLIPIAVAGLAGLVFGQKAVHPVADGKFWRINEAETITNSTVDLKVITTLETNWLPITIDEPNGNGGSTPRNHEIGILKSNRVAHVYADGVTQRVFISSAVHLPGMMLIREKAKEAGQVYFLTNWFTTPNIVITNGGPYFH